MLFAAKSEASSRTFSLSFFLEMMDLLPFVLPVLLPVSRQFYNYPVSRCSFNYPSHASIRSTHPVILIALCPPERVRSDVRNRFFHGRKRSVTPKSSCGESRINRQSCRSTADSLHYDSLIPHLSSNLGSRYTARTILIAACFSNRARIAHCYRGRLFFFFFFSPQIERDIFRSSDAACVSQRLAIES